MPTLLVLNPNTSDAVSATLHRHAVAAAPPGGTVRVATARFGARYISDEVAAAIAGHAALDAFAAHVAVHGQPDAVLLGCFGDPGLFALRALSPVPVLGLAEAAMGEAAGHGPFVVLTGGHAWGPMLARLLPGLALPAPCLGVHTLAPGGGAIAADPDAGAELLRAGAREALARWPSAQALLIGGAGLAGFAARLAPPLPLPVLDSVELAMAAAWRVARQQRTPPAGPAADPSPASTAAWTGLAPELARWLVPAGP